MLRTRLPLLALAAALALSLSLSPQKGLAVNANQKPAAAQSHPCVGMWVTADGHIRHELLPNGRYDEARGSRESAYRAATRCGAITSTIGTTPVSPPMATSSTACCTMPA